MSENRVTLEIDDVMVGLDEVVEEQKKENEYFFLVNEPLVNCEMDRNIG